MCPTVRPAAQSRGRRGIRPIRARGPALAAGGRAGSALVPVRPVESPTAGRGDPMTHAEDNNSRARPGEPSAGTPAPGARPAFALLVRETVLAVQGRFSDLGRLRRDHPELAGREGREALLQVHLFAGFPRVVEAFQVLAEVGGMGQPEPDEIRAEPPMHERGRGLFARIYGAGAPQVEGILHDAHPDLADWVLGHAYGRVLTRPGLEPKERELLAVAALAASHQDRQLASHVRGAMACGATPGELNAVLELLIPHLSEDDHRRAAAVVARFSIAPDRDT